MSLIDSLVRAADGRWSRGESWDKWIGTGSFDCSRIACREFRRATSDTRVTAREAKSTSGNRLGMFPLTDRAQRSENKERKIVAMEDELQGSRYHEPRSEHLKRSLSYRYNGDELQGTAVRHMSIYCRDRRL